MAEVKARKLESLMPKLKPVGKSKPTDEQIKAAKERGVRRANGGETSLEWLNRNYEYRNTDTDLDKIENEAFESSMRQKKAKGSAKPAQVKQEKKDSFNSKEIGTSVLFDIIRGEQQRSEKERHKPPRRYL